jgi:hypothetical protein
VNEPQTKQELDAIRLSVNRGQPFGNDDWQKRTAERLGLEFTLHPRGRPPQRQCITIMGLIPFFGPGGSRPAQAAIQRIR